MINFIKCLCTRRYSLVRLSETSVASVRSFTVSSSTGRSFTGRRSIGSSGIGNLFARLLSLTLLVIGFLVATDPVVGQQLNLPEPGKKPKSGLLLRVNADWVNNTGYFPIRVRLLAWPPGSNQADRKLKIRLTPASYYGMRTTVLEKEVTLPEGANSMLVELDMLQQGITHGFKVEVTEGGRRLDDISTRSTNYFGVSWYEWTESSPALLFLDRDAGNISARSATLQKFNASGRSLQMMGTPTYDLPDPRQLVNLLPLPNQSYAFNVTDRAADPQALQTFADIPKLDLKSPSEMPTHWLHWTCYDICFIRLPDLQDMLARQEDQFQALKRWLESGGTLNITDAGEAYEELETIEKLLGLTPLAEGEPAIRGWNEPQASRFDDAIDFQQLDINSYMQMNSYGQTVPPPNVTVGPGERLIARNPNRPKPPEDPPFVLRSAGMGLVVAWEGTEADVYPGKRTNWAWMFNEISPTRWKWFQRHGLSLHRDNRDFWNLLVPGVGRPPVTTFLVMISGFVIVIGPVNYLLLRRSSRLYLLLLTVPVGAALFTMGIFCYALISDGLGTKVRIRSYSELNQRSGTGVSWSRQSYYSAIAPSRGLEFPNSAAVYPFDARMTRQNQGQRQSVVLGDETRQLRNGHMQSRTNAQMLVVQSVRCDARLDVDEADGSVQVTNRLGTPIQSLVLRTYDGRWYFGARIDDKARATLEASEQQRAGQAIAQRFQEEMPDFPEGLDRLGGETYEFGMNYYWGNDVDDNEVAPTFVTSLLEQELRQACADINLQPGEYVVLVDHSPLVPLGIATARQKASFHVIRGSW